VVFKEIREKIKKFLQSNQKEKITHQNLWKIMKEIPGGKCIPMSAYITKSEGTQIRK
jgi:hypothetical protein